MRQTDEKVSRKWRYKGDGDRKRDRDRVDK
jgi:hypothetical protein